MEIDYLDETSYDAIIVGSSLSQTILFCALARAGKKVLLLEPQIHYGGHMSSLPLNEFNSYMDSLVQRDSQGFILFQNDGGNFSYKSLSNEENCVKRDIPSFEGRILPLATSLSKPIELPPDHSAYIDPVSPHHTPVPVIHHPVVFQQGEMRESSYTLDLTPQTILCSSRCVESLVNTNVNSYLDFRAINHTVRATASSKPLPPTQAALVSELVDQTVSAYCIQHSLPIPPSQYSFSAVPVSKAAVFSDSSLSLLAKNRLMTLISVLLHDARAPHTTKHHLDLFETYRHLPLQTLLKELGAENLFDVVVFGVLMWIGTADCANTSPQSTDSSADSPLPPSLLITVDVASHRLSAYLASLGKYTDGAYLYPAYGMGELGQAWARSGCVWGGGVVLRADVRGVLVSDSDSGEGSVAGVVMGSNQLLQSKYVVVDNSLYLDTSRSSTLPLTSTEHSTAHTAPTPSTPSTSPSAHTTSYHHATVILSRPLLCGSGSPLPSMSLLSFAPAQTGLAHGVRGLYLDEDSGQCGRGEYIVYLTTLAESPSRSSSPSDAHTQWEAIHDYQGGSSASSSNSQSTPNTSNNNNTSNDGFTNNLAFHTLGPLLATLVKQGYSNSSQLDDSTNTDDSINTDNTNNSTNTNDSTNTDSSDSVTDHSTIINGSDSVADHSVTDTATIEPINDSPKGASSSLPHPNLFPAHVLYLACYSSTHSSHPHPAHATVFTPSLPSPSVTSTDSSNTNSSNTDNHNTDNHTSHAPLSGLYVTGENGSMWTDCDVHFVAAELVYNDILQLSSRGRGLAFLAERDLPSHSHSTGSSTSSSLDNVEDSDAIEDSSLESESNNTHGDSVESNSTQTDVTDMDSHNSDSVESHTSTHTNSSPDSSECTHSPPTTQSASDHERNTYVVDEEEGITVTAKNYGLEEAAKALEDLEYELELLEENLDDLDLDLNF